MPELVSIVIPAFHAGRFLGRALEGVRAQTHTRWEVIVVEDGTRDETEAVVRAFAAQVPQNVRYENNGENLGVSTTRNKGMALAQGGVIAFLDADDRWTPEHLACGLETLERGAVLCFSGFHVYDERTAAVVESVVPRVEQMGDPLAALFKGNYIQTSSLVMVRRDAAQRAGGFDPGLRVGEDADYWLRILSFGGGLACTGKVTCFYSKHESSAMAKTLMVAEHGVKFFRKHLDSAFLPAALRRERYASSLWTRGRLVRRDDPRLARSLFFAAWRCRPLCLQYLGYALATYFLK